MEFKRQARLRGSEFSFDKFYPCLNERLQESGVASGHYFHQDLLVANKIFKNNPLKHLDIGFRVDGLVAHVASFREIEVFDIRKLKSAIKNILFTQLDLMDKALGIAD